MKLKYIVAALGLVGSAASQAALVVPGAAGEGEMALVVYDLNASYTLDLGITFNQFMAAANTTNANLATLNSANWTSFVAAEGGSSADWQYAIIGGNAGGSVGVKVLSTISADAVGTVGDNFAGPDVQTAITQVVTQYQYVNPTGTHKTQANGDSYNLAGTDAYYLTYGMDTFNSSFYQNNATVGTAMAMDLVTRAQSVAVESTLAGMANLSLTNGNFVLSYTVSAVPEAPGLTMTAVGCALLGFLSLRRRNRG